MSSSNPDKPSPMLEKIERKVRRSMTKTVDAECASLRAAGKRVMRLEPGPEALKAIGYNMMDPKRRLQVFETALHETQSYLVA